MKNFKYLVIATSVLMLLGFSTNAQASTLYGLAQEFAVDLGLDDTTINMEQERPQAKFYSIDPDTGIPTVIGDTGFELCTALDFEPITNRAFAVCDRIRKENGGGGIEVIAPLSNRLEEIPIEEVGQVLIMLDMTTGQGTEIGPLGFLSKGAALTDISFRQDGTLFGIVSQNVAVQIPNGGLETKMLEFEEVTLVTIDKDTGQATIVGPTGTGDSTDAIGFGAQNNLYHATDNILDPGALNMLDHTSGAGTNIGDLVYPEGFDGENIINFVTSLDYSSSDNQLYGMLISFMGQGPGPESRIEFADGSFLFRTNPDTGIIELIGFTAPFGNQFTSIAFLNRNFTEVPTLSEYGLIVTGILFLGAAVVFLRRRQARSEV